jgi:hypothetical protein
MSTSKARVCMVLAAVLCLLAAVASGQTTRRGLAHRGQFQPSATGRETATPAANPKWTVLFPNQILDGRWAGAGAYDAATNSLLVFGGSGFSGGGIVGGVTNDLLSLSNANGIGTGTWTQVIPYGDPGSPPARDTHTAVYDAANSRLIVFGGCAWVGQNCTTLLNDVWVLTNANGQAGTPTWVQLSPAGTPPAGRWAHSAAYDPVNNRMMIYGGDDNQSPVTFSDTWVLSNANGLGGTPTWTQLLPTGGPPEGQDISSVVYDAANNVLIQFAGVTHNFLAGTNSVWSLSNANGLGGAPVWKKLIANGAAGSPSKRDGQVATYDSTNNRMTIFGGDSNTASGFPNLNDVWVLVNANGLSGTPAWTKLAPTGIPPDRRANAVGAYDSANNLLIIFGGGSWDGAFFSTWVLSGANGL